MRPIIDTRWPVGVGREPPGPRRARRDRDGAPGRLRADSRLSARRKRGKALPRPAGDYRRAIDSGLFCVARSAGRRRLRRRFLLSDGEPILVEMGSCYVAPPFRGFGLQKLLVRARIAAVVAASIPTPASSPPSRRKISAPARRSSRPASNPWASMSACSSSSAPIASRAPAKPPIGCAVATFSIFREAASAARSPRCYSRAGARDAGERGGLVGHNGDRRAEAAPRGARRLRPRECAARRRRRCEDGMRKSVCTFSARIPL